MIFTPNHYLNLIKNTSIYYKMKIFILNGFIYCEETSEKISINEVNIGLTDFYKKPIEINSDNIREFEGDLEALCFGFNSNDDSQYNEADY
jgi:hypothetical protein